ncbi:FtsX-like permease family protein [Ureibacillus terrenus]|uniref:ABC transporter permease n=1 Tax=Ureibacillus terrenus TaxID=118246 RepID=A0A540V2N5_9BACL|nr:ABC transporter permease [Ureibacillus terrenus]TQE91000.1 ABC transporter permease [Ureibacillus terrenus]
MTLTSLVLRSMKKNVKHYYLYFFALIFSVTLCFSFVTIQYNPSVIEALEASGTATAGFESITYVLYFILIFFILYANQIFMKRRSKEIGLYQLIGMTKGFVFRLLLIENVVLFSLAAGIGMVLGFVASRFFAMILMKLMKNDAIVSLSFSMMAFSKSLIIFALLLAVVMIQIFIMIRKASLLSLFNAEKKADERVKKFSPFHMMMGIVGICLIAYGYYDSTRLFSVEGATTNNLLVNMLLILGSSILGTYLFFRYSVALIMNLIRKSKKGYLKITDVLGVTTIMHRMKGNASSLTLITVLTGLAVGIMTLSYISYYSSEADAKRLSPFDYILFDNKGIEFLNQLEAEGIEYEKTTFHLSMVNVKMSDLFNLDEKDAGYININQDAISPVVPLSDYKAINPEARLNDGETIITSYVDILSELLPLESGKKIRIHAGEKNYSLFIKDVREDEFFLSVLASASSPVLIVTDELFDEIQKNQNPEISTQIGINLVNEKDHEKAETLYKNLRERKIIEYDYQKTYKEYYDGNIALNGMTIFVTGFLGMAFLLTTGSILYFKQMGEAEDERESYTILRKIGFSNGELMRGIYVKQLFNFGMPLMIGLLHSYFAVKSGWWLFGSEMVTPMIIIILFYVSMYMVFGILSVFYYKKIVKEAL